MSRFNAGNLASCLKATIMVCITASIFGCASTVPGKCECFKVVRSDFLGTVWNQGHANASVVSQDGGFSYRVPGGSLWCFGDTFKGSRDPAGNPQFSGGAVSCCIARLGETIDSLPPVLRYLTGRDGKVAQAIDFLPDESWDHNRIWPLSGIYFNAKSYIYYSLIELTGEGMWGFQDAGSGLACSTQPLTVHKRIQTPKGWRFPVAPTAIVMTDEWMYLFDVGKRDGGQGIWLSRVRPAEIENPDGYQFYCGPGPRFTPDKNKQVLFLGDIYGQVSVVWNAYLDRYILASSSNIFHPREIRFYTAENPWGPWEQAVSITVPEYRQGKKVELVYCSYFHPELFRDNGRIMNLTFSLHLEDGGFDVNNEMIEVEINSSDA
ncbi:MAG: DUF4185 domain-containing protein [Sedimentisphaerales bacterium]|nr:DUF4185 domain-containing protein [Sedimentisphaerales bacterium]